MATRCMIVVRMPKQSIIEYTGIYCHNDGDPKEAGKVLLEHYNDWQRAYNLACLGGISRLGARMAPNKGESHSFDKPAPGVTVAYHRDRGDGKEPRRCFGASVDKIAKVYFGIEYLYVYNGEWYVGKWSEAAVEKGWPFKGVLLYSVLGVENKEKAEA